MGYQIVSITGEYTAQKSGITYRYWGATIATFKAKPIPESGIVGDVDDDEYVTSTDALIILSCEVGLNTSMFCPMNCGDVDNDGLITSTDALIILSFEVGYSVPFPVGESGCPPSVTPCDGCNP